MKRREFLRSSLITATLGVAATRYSYATPRTGKTPDVAAISGDGREIVLRGRDIDDLADKLRGGVLLSGDDGYDAARWIRNPSFDKHPALIVQPANVADVQSAVAFARAHQLLVAVKCGGHSYSGHSTCERGMQIDLSTFRGVRVDPTARRAFVSGGTLLGQVDRAASVHGLVTPLGTVSHTGVGGLTLGGGFGRLARRFGMAIDNLESVEIVTADGKLVRAGASENPELFWGARGGGGNFGIVTAFEFRLHPMQREVIAGRVTFPIARARDVLGMWGEYATSAPDELYMDPSLELPPGGAPGSVSLEICYSGATRDAERVLAPIRKLGTPSSDTIKAMDYVQTQSMNDSTDSRAVASYLKSGFIPQVPQGLVAAIVDGLHGDPQRATVLFFQHCGGASARPQEQSTAFSHRDAVANMMAVAAWPLGKVDPSTHIEATRQYWKALEPFTRGFYVNDMPHEATTQDINANYRGNYARLTALKTKYDPTNLFRLNANVQPAKG
jgi:FAD/FMN-containing dehydrogenase